MASTKDFRDFVLEQLRDLEDILCKGMMGEFLLYKGQILFGGVYDNRLLIKKTNSNKRYGLPEEIPYKNAKPMFMIEDIDDKDKLYQIIEETCQDLIDNKKA